jgi:hypothetical protein
MLTELNTDHQGYLAVILCGFEKLFGSGSRSRDNLLNGWGKVCEWFNRARLGIWALARWTRYLTCIYLPIITTINYTQFSAGW